MGSMNLVVVLKGANKLKGLASNFVGAQQQRSQRYGVGRSAIHSH